MGPSTCTIVIVSFNTEPLARADVRRARRGRGRAVDAGHRRRQRFARWLGRWLRAHRPQAELIANDVNVGFGRANNQADPVDPRRSRASAQHRRLRVARHADPTLAWMRAHPDCGVLGVRLVGRDGAQQPSCRNFPTPANTFLMRTGLARFFPWDARHRRPALGTRRVADCDWVPGCYYLMPRAVLNEVGLFDPRYFLYFEEVDHCKRVKQAGWRVRYCADTSVVHLGGESAKTDGEITESGRQISALQIESELLFFRKHHGRIGLRRRCAHRDRQRLPGAEVGVMRRDVAGAHAVLAHTGHHWSLLRRTGGATHPTR
jgi:GT2 family glycosyltransferase